MILVEQLTKTYLSDVPAVSELSFCLTTGETLAIIGASGCGKTTTLKMLNCMIRPTAGRVVIGGKDVSQVDGNTLRRGIGYVIQGGALFPHRTVAQNIGLVPRLLKWDTRRIQKRVGELLNLVGLPEEYRDRYPSQLSGGQQQRVGIARALAADPPIILLDEPFSALDPITRRQLQDEFLKIKAELLKTQVLVTHDLKEAFLLADQVLLMDRGKMQQLGSPETLQSHPVNAFVERFIQSHL